jgi:hypothetical protein
VRSMPRAVVTDASTPQPSMIDEESGETCTRGLHATSARSTDRGKCVALSGAGAPFRVMGGSLSRGEPVTVVIDSTPTLTTDAAAALLRLLQNVAADQQRGDRADAAGVVAS